MAHHHDCECGHDHHHEHEHESNSVQIDRYHEAFNKFEPALPDTQTTEAVNALLEKHFQENFTPEVLKTIHGCIDLTSLTSLDTKESIWKMVDTVNDFEGTRPDVPNVAAICVYPLFVETVKQALTAQEIKIASVAGGFPSSQTFTEVKIAETAMAVMQGADEIDVVMNLGYFMEDNFEELTEELQEIKESCRHAHLKVILETGALVTAENIQKASILAMYSGADFIKTSTGKGYPGAHFRGRLYHVQSHQNLPFHHRKQGWHQDLRRRTHGGRRSSILYDRKGNTGQRMAEQGFVPYRSEQSGR